MAGANTTGSRRPGKAASRRSFVTGLVTAGACPTSRMSHAAAPGTQTGAAVLAESQFAALAGKTIGLVTNHTGRVGSNHLVDLIVATPRVRLGAIFAPEHGFRGTAEAGARVASSRDAKTGIPIFSLYGATKAPTADMLSGLDLLVFDIQDIGARFYTYISTMGLALQAAARASIPFVVLDRPNPLGGVGMAGFVLEPKYRSFVGQYPIPIVHGLTVGELARMTKGERWLADVAAADLQVIACRGWSRVMRWPDTGLPWIATSPNIPTFESALVYPGVGLIGETEMNEGRGTPIPFSQFGAPWLDAPRLAQELAAERLPGARFSAVRYTPHAIRHVAVHPKFANREIAGVRIGVSDVWQYLPLHVGIHALALLHAEARALREPLLPEKLGMFHAISGTARLQRLLARGARGADIVAAWQNEVSRFAERRRQYLLY